MAAPWAPALTMGWIGILLLAFIALGSSRRYRHSQAPLLLVVVVVIVIAVQAVKSHAL